MDIHLAFVVGNQGFFRTIEGQAFTLGTLTELSDVVQTKNHILCRHSDRRTIGRVQNIVSLEHQHLSFQYCFITQWQVNRHLVTVEVGVERSTCQRVQLDSLTFNHVRLECLDTETVQCRCTVEQYRVTLHDMFEDIEHDSFLAVYNLLGTLYGLHNTAFNQLTDDERLVKFGSHELRNTTFTHLQFRTYNDYRTCRVVHTLTQQVLTETTLLTLQTV